MWPFNREPKKEEIDAAVESAEKGMQPNPLDEIEDIHLGDFILGNLLCVSEGGLFIDPADIVLLCVHPRSAEIMFRNGKTYRLSRYGAHQAAKTIAQQMRGRRT